MIVEFNFIVERTVHCNFFKTASRILVLCFIVWYFGDNCGAGRVLERSIVGRTKFVSFENRFHFKIISRLRVCASKWSGIYNNLPFMLVVLLYWLTCIYCCMALNRNTLYQVVSATRPLNNHAPCRFQRILLFRPVYSYLLRFLWQSTMPRRIMRGT